VNRWELNDIHIKIWRSAFLTAPTPGGKSDSLGGSEALIEVIHLGTELEGIWSLIPERLGESLAEIRSKGIKVFESRG
jgi:hypothetical protein